MNYQQPRASHPMMSSPQLPSLPRHARVLLSALALLLGSVSSAPAQSSDTGSISGRVRNRASGTALQGASVTLSGTERFFALTNEDGAFRLNHVPAGPHTLLVDYTGLNTGSTAVTVVANEQVDVAVE